MLRRIAVWCVICALVLCRPSSARANVTTDVFTFMNIAVSGTCTVNNGETLSGTYSTTQGTATTFSPATPFSVTCSNDLLYSITANTGLNGSHATGTCQGSSCTKAMANGSNYLSYDVFYGSTLVPSSGTSLSSVGTGAAQTYSMTAYLPALQADPTGTYTDTVTVTVTW